MPKIILDNFNRGGISDSRFSGGNSSLPSIVGFDLHSTPGLLKVAQKLTKESGSTVDELCKVGVTASDGNTYLFSSTSGKIWKRTSAGAYSLAYTTVPAAGSAGCLGAAEYMGYIYWATQNRLHRIAIANASAFLTVDLNWQSFANGDADFHPFIEVNQVLYIGDGKYIAQVDNGTWSNNALDIPSQYRVSAFGRANTDLLIGTFISDNIAQARVFAWNTWSVSWSSDVSVSEVGVNAFLPFDNGIVVSVGKVGNLYAYTGTGLQLFKRIPGEYSPTANARINNNAVVNINGSVLFGLSNISNNPVKQGVYQLGRFSNEYPLVLSLDYPISVGSVSDIQVGCILAVGTDILVAWKSGSSTYGVDKLDYTLKYPLAYFETMVIGYNRDDIKTFKQFIADYASLPASTSFNIKYKRAGDTTWQSLDPVADNDTERRQFSAESSLSTTELEVRVEFVASGNNAPELEDFVIIVD